MSTTLEKIYPMKVIFKKKQKKRLRKVLICLIEVFIMEKE